MLSHLELQNLSDAQIFLLTIDSLLYGDGLNLQANLAHQLEKIITNSYNIYTLRRASKDRSYRKWQHKSRNNERGHGGPTTYHCGTLSNIGMLAQPPLNTQNLVIS
jgi:hypothetical protein